MKKYLAMVMCLLLAAAMLSACGSKTEQAQDTSAPATESVPPSVSEEPETTETTAPVTESVSQSAMESETSQGASAAIITDESLASADTNSGQIRGGTNQDDAVMLPMNTLLYGQTSGDNGLWYAFTTNSTPNATYAITAVNKTLDTNPLCLEVRTAEGNSVGDRLRANQGGRAATINVRLDPDITYYICIWADAGDTIDYRLSISSPDVEYSGYSTANSLADARGEADALEGEIHPGTNQDDAAMLPTNVKIGGTVTGGVNSWFAFTTNSVPNATYSLTVVNKTVDSDPLCLEVVTFEGSSVGDRLRANQGGAATTINVKLDPDTTYYIVLWVDSKDTIEYSLSIQAPEEPKAQSAAVEESKENLVFEKPFELTETQVMFQPESADFVDQAAAEKALKPVADVILKHPDHSILLAGTTATDGDQAARVDLSNKRAQAVKTLLVQSFGVPESQLQTVGLGYAADPFVRGVDRNPKGDPSGKFIESEGAKNRRVVVMDAEDPVAKQILKSGS